MHLTTPIHLDADVMSYICRGFYVKVRISGDDITQSDTAGHAMVNTDYLNELDGHGSYRGNELKQRNPALAATPAHWRAVLFSVAFPLPQDVSLGDASLLDATSSPWLDGRYEGIKGVEYYPATPEAEDADTAETTAPIQRLEFKNPKANPASYFGSELAGYFRPGRGQSAVYKHATRKSIHSWLEKTAATNPASTEQWLADAGLETALPYQLITDVAAGAGMAKFGRLALLPGQWSTTGEIDEWEHGSLQLHAVECLSYPRATPTPDEAEPASRQHFLVFHVLAENCSSAQLERISQALARPADDFPAQLVTPSVPASRHPSLPDSAAPATDQAPVYPLTQNLLEVAKLLLAPSDAPAQLAALRVNEDGGLGDSALPSRSVVALPARADVPGPASFPEADAWTAHEQWAWELAAGADTDDQRPPQDTRDSLDKYTAEESDNWSILATDNGLAVVRTDTDYRDNPTPFVQAPTFFIELLLLNMRARTELTELREDLSSGLDPAAAHQRWEQIQEELWLDEIPRRPNLTQVLLTARRASGVQELHDDVAGALADDAEPQTAAPEPDSPTVIEPEQVTVTPEDPDAAPPTVKKASESPAEQRKIAPALLAVLIVLGVLVVLNRSRKQR